MKEAARACLCVGSSAVAMALGKMRIRVRVRVHTRACTDKDTKVNCTLAQRRQSIAW